MEINAMHTSPTVDMWNLIRRLSEITPETRNTVLVMVDSFVNGMAVQEKLPKPST